MRQATRLRTALVTLLLTPIAGVTVVGSSAAAQGAQPYKASSISSTGRVDAIKTSSSRLAKTDPSLLGRSDTAQVAVLIKLDVDSVATYAGGVSGYAATSPTATGRKLVGSAAEKRYESYLAGKENAFIKALGQKVPGAKVSTRLRTVYGGVSAIVPANKISEVLKIAGVSAVQKNDLRQPMTDSSAAFIGATSLYPVLGGASNAGKGVIYGVIDTGAWPEHPSFADLGNLSTPPAKADGTARACNFGDNPLTPATDVFACNNKLIGGEKFLDAYETFNADNPYSSARDSGGHGTHTGSTSAGNLLASAPVFGVDRGPLGGIAPGAWVAVYKALGPQGGYSSDLAAAIQQAVLDGVQVINYSISGGENPFTDPAELAFLDAYAAGVFVAASAGNSGPGAATVAHVSPWVTTVAASTQAREFVSTLTVTSGADTYMVEGASITDGAGSFPVVLASAAPYSDPLCQSVAPAGLFTGKIVACQRGVNARIEKGYNVTQGDAAGMILYNTVLADIETDNHWLPTVHLADGTALVRFLTNHGASTASFTAGTKHNGPGDVMAAFSSRGPGGLGIKPDITGPGVSILAGNTPTPLADGPAGGPAGEYFQAIAGTSMSAPHLAGSAVLLKALHPNWTPGQIKSALMTTAKQSVVKEDLTTPADPFDYGSGRVDLTKAGTPGLTFDETAERMFALGNDPINAVHLNLPSINAPVLPGRLTTVRTATNVTSRWQTYKVSASAPDGSRITVSPSTLMLAPGTSGKITITISSTAKTAQYFGEVKLQPKRTDLPALHLPVAFVPQQGSVSLASTCTPTSIKMYTTSTCEVTAVNNSFGDATTDFKTTVTPNLSVLSATDATVKNAFTVEKGVTLTGAQPGVPSIAPGVGPAGYLPLELFGIPAEAVGDESILNFDVPSYVFNGKTYERFGVDSNGYLVVGGATSEDNNCCNLTQIPDPARPNNVLAPFWTDLDGTGAEGIRVANLTDGVNSWLVVEWQVNVWGTTSNRHFQVWIGINGTQDISYAYDPSALPADPSGQPFLVGAENEFGTGGAQLPAGVLPTEDLIVTSTDPAPGASVTYSVKVLGLIPGTGIVQSEMTASTVPGVTVVRSTVTVTKRSYSGQE